MVNRSKHPGTRQSRDKPGNKQPGDKQQVCGWLCSCHTTSLQTSSQATSSKLIGLAGMQPGVADSQPCEMHHTGSENNQWQACRQNKTSLLRLGEHPVAWPKVLPGGRFRVSSSQTKLVFIPGEKATGHRGMGLPPVRTGTHKSRRNRTKESNGCDSSDNKR